MADRSKAGKLAGERMSSDATRSNAQEVFQLLDILEGKTSLQEHPSRRYCPGKAFEHAA